MLTDIPTQESQASCYDGGRGTHLQEDTLLGLSLTHNNNSERRNWFALAIFALEINYSAEIMQTWWKNLKRCARQYKDECMLARMHDCNMLLALAIRVSN